MDDPRCIEKQRGPRFNYVLVFTVVELTAAKATPDVLWRFERALKVRDIDRSVNQVPATLSHDFILSRDILFHVSTLLAHHHACRDMLTETTNVNRRHTKKTRVLMPA